MARGLDAQSTTALRANHQTLEQVDPDRFLDGLDGGPAVGSRSLAALPQVFADDRLVMPF